MTRLRTSSALALASMALSAIAILGVSSGTAEAQTRTIRVSNLYPENHPSCNQTHRFGEIVEDRTGGDIEVKVYCNNQLGNEREASEGVRAGTLEMVVSGGGGLGRFIPELYMLELPFLYQDIDQINTVTWPLHDDINVLANEKGFQFLGYAYEGPRSINSVKPFTTLEEMKGYKLRIPEAPLYVGLARALGAVPTPTAFTEAYTALQTGVADGMESSPSTTYTNKFYEVAPNFVQTKHIINPVYLAINLEYFNALSDEQKKILEDAGRESTDAMVADLKASNEAAIKKMQEEGMKLVELAPGERDKFKVAASDFSTEYAKSVGDRAVDLLEKIRNELDGK